MIWNNLVVIQKLKQIRNKTIVSATKEHVNVIMIVAVDLIVDVVQNFKFMISVSAIKDVNVGIIANVTKNALAVLNIKKQIKQYNWKKEIKLIYVVVGLNVTILLSAIVGLNVNVQKVKKHLSKLNKNKQKLLSPTVQRNLRL